MEQTEKSLAFGSFERAPLILISALAVVGAVALWFVARSTHYVTNFSVTSFTDYYWPRRWGLLPHLLAGTTAISVGVVQVWLGLTGRIGVLHRILGRIYVGAVAIASVGAMYMALTIPGHVAYSSGLFGLDIAWIVTTAMALIAIRGRHVAQHRMWMLRSYTVTLAFAVFRLLDPWLNSLVHMPDDPVATDMDALVAWSCWVFPLMLLEVVTQLRAMRTGVASL
jgi:uncharacterized membrane protein